MQVSDIASAVSHIRRGCGNDAASDFALNLDHTKTAERRFGDAAV